MDNKNKTGSYQKTLMWVVNLFEQYVQNRLDEKSRKKIDNWNPEDIPERFTASDEILDEGCIRVTKKVYSQLGFVSKDSPKKRRLLSSIYYKYAAVAAILIVATCSVPYLLNDITTSPSEIAVISKENLVEYIAKNEIKKVTLPDGTQLSINRGGRLSYNQNKFNQKEREVWLEGEAYFDVAKNPEKLFIIHSGKLQTVVRGTSFIVKAYEELDEMSISVKTGRVEITEKEKTIATLNPNQQLLYMKTDGSVQKSETNWEDVAAWMDGKLVLQNATIDEFMLRIKHLYGKDIVIASNILKDERLVMSFESGTSFTGVMDAICTLYDVKYKETSPNRVTIYQ